MELRPSTNNNLLCTLDENTGGHIYTVTVPLTVA